MTQEAVVEAPSPPPAGPIAQLLQSIMPGVRMDIVATPMDECIVLQRDDFVRVMQTLRDDPRLAFDYLRCQSGVDYLSELESVYHLYSFKNKHSLAVKVRFPSVDPHMPTVSHLWAAANWHERETHEMFGMVFDGHPDLRALLTEEGMGYFPLLKSHPLADIEEWQEDILSAIDKAKRQTAEAAGGPPPPMSKVEIAQAKAKLMKEARDKARAAGLSPEDEKAAVRAAIDKFEADLASGAIGAAAGAPAAPAMSKVEMAQAKARVITKARAEARGQGMATEDEKKYVAEKLKEFSAQLDAAPAAAPAPAPKPAMSKVEMAQAKARVITKARAEARAKGMTTEDEKKFVAEALKKFSEENS
ncbi:MAG: NADH-quinone oxidoreductase subunit C [Chloroflexota bacterium]